MFPIKNIRQHVTEKLQEVTVLRKYRDNSGILLISETADKNDDDRKPDIGKELLDKIEINSLPLNNTWIFENEFSHQLHVGNNLLADQKGAFTSAGKKVEKTIFYYDSNRLYLVMIEMKRTVSPRKMQEDVVKKFENSLSTISVFLSAHIDFPLLEEAVLYPVGVCCYNYYDDPQPNYNRDPRRVAGCVRNKYSTGDRVIPISIEPVGFNKMTSPVLFFENPNRDPVTKSFSIDFQDILQKL